ncbi:MAG: extracellular solute-binding protein [Mycobacterium sp.]|nr:extracellular solute-binding protein [Mycobacterium sp.]
MSSGMSRRHFLALCGEVSAATGVLAACGSGAGGNSIATWAAFSSNEDQKYFQTHTVNAYNSNHKVKVELSIKQTATINQLMQTSLASGRGPDIIGSDGPTIVVDFADAGYLAPLDEYSKKFDWPSKIQPWALETGTSKGKLYGIPTSYESVVMLYNTDTFSKNGWKPPTNKDEFEALCKEAKGKGMSPVAAGNAEFRKATEWHVTAMINEFAGPEAVHQALTGKLPWSSPVFVDSISLLASYFKKSWYGGGPESYFTYKFADLYTQLAQGKAAMMITGSWGFTEIPPYFGKAAGNTANWDWAPLPKFANDVPNDVYVLAIGGDNSINKKSKHLDDAATFLDWTLDPKRATAEVAAINGQLPPIKVEPSDFPSSVDERLKRFYLALNATKDVGYATWTSFPPQTDTYIYQSMDKVITGKMTPKAFCAGMDKVFQPELKAGKVPPLSSPHSGS